MKKSEGREWEWAEGAAYCLRQYGGRAAGYFYKYAVATQFFADSEHTAGVLDMGNTNIEYIFEYLFNHVISQIFAD